MRSLCLEELCVSLSGKSILKEINTQFTGGDFTSILGPNGSGKTTLLKAIMGMVRSQGRISCFENTTPVARLESSYLCQFIHSNCQLTVIEMVLLGFVKQLSWQVTPEQESQAEQILSEFNLLKIATRRFNTLSGGQQQLVAMAQALVSKPSMLLLDEPISALDIRHQIQVLEIAKDYTKNTKTITITVLHDLSLAARYSDKFVLLNDGHVVEAGSPAKVLQPELLEQVYQVKVEVGYCSNGYLHITPTIPTDINVN
ncbi:ABC transporter ATP-binding protein [Spartinivicinus poritis]|uniref:ABC transporter ATP-binding protein n=1 Tax=Spartinivicinus poritis TaxID=2994640 RepID=A0ABT5UBD5_9GAMM|nr:ABC transporter ATP-binding protein [Spartinivicinus sp. A2-2]MDE1463688.1 ABC transporter ATP-binding protein [Spartinivicinus sp. A2-2]